MERESQNKKTKSSLIANGSIYERYWEPGIEGVPDLGLNPLEVGEIHLWYSQRNKDNKTGGVEYFKDLIAAYIGEEFQLKRTENGKPILIERKKGSPSMAFSISHTDELIALAFARAQTIGLDIEKVRPVNRLERVVQKYFSEKEQNYILEELTDARASKNAAELRIRRFIQIWTLKEALIKSQGGNLLLDINKTNLTFVDLNSSGEMLFSSEVWPDLSLVSQLKVASRLKSPFSFFQAIAVDF